MSADNVMRVKLRVLRELHGASHAFAVTSMLVYPTARPLEARFVPAPPEAPDPPEMIRLARAFWSAWSKLWNLSGPDTVPVSEVRASKQC